MAAARNHAGRVAILFGSEKFGLSNEDMSFCHGLIRIPTLSGNTFDEIWDKQSQFVSTN